MNKAEENYIEHEVKIRMQDEKYLNLREDIKSIKAQFEKIDTKMDLQFRWLVSILFGLFGALLLTKLLTW